MVKEIKIKGKKYFKCKFCKTIYKERKIADEHEDFCKNYNAQILKSSELKEVEGY